MRKELEHKAIIAAAAAVEWERASTLEDLQKSFEKFIIQSILSSFRELETTSAGTLTIQRDGKDDTTLAIEFGDTNGQPLVVHTDFVVSVVLGGKVLIEGNHQGDTDGD